MSAPDPTVLGIDLGTSSVKVVLADRSGTVLRQSTQPYGVQRTRPGWAETDPEQWWDAIVTGVREVAAAAELPAPSGIGLSGQMHGVVLVDADGVSLRPAILWADSRAGEQLEIVRSLPPTVTDRLANPLSPGMAGPILGWLVEHEPASVTGATAAVQPKDWVRARLTGRLASEPSDASATLLYDVIDQTWSAGVLEALRIPPALMPPILPSAAAVAGTLQASPAQQLGLPTGVPVAAGAADTAAAALGSGLVTPGDWQLTIGTGVQIITVVPPPTQQMLTPIEQTLTHLYRSATAASGWYAMAASLTGGTTLDWVRRLLGASWADLYAAARHRPGAEDPISPAPPDGRADPVPRHRHARQLDVPRRRPHPRAPALRSAGGRGVRCDGLPAGPALLSRW